MLAGLARIEMRGNAWVNCRPSQILHGGGFNHQPIEIKFPPTQIVIVTNKNDASNGMMLAWYP